MTNLVNPTREQQASLTIGDSYTVTGELLSMEKIERSYSSDVQVRVRTEEGRIYTATGYGSTLTYNNGALENLRGEKAEVGETISVIINIGFDKGHRKESLDYTKVTLLKPSDQRQRAYDDLRVTVGDKLSILKGVISSGTFADARRRYAELRTLALTKTEGADLKATFETWPASEKPISGSSYDRDAILKGFNVNVEEFSAEEFLGFARRVLHGEIENASKPDRCDQSYLFHYLDQEPFAIEQYIELLESTLKVRIGRLENTIGENRDADWDNSWLIEQSVTYLGSTKDPRVVPILVWLIDYCLERGYFDTRLTSSEDYPDRKFGSLLAKAIEALYHFAVYYNGRADADFDSGRLIACANRLNGYPYMGSEARKIRTLIVPLNAR